MEKDFLTIDEVANTLDLTRQTVSKYIKNKQLNAVKINRTYRIPLPDFQEFMNEHTTVSDVNVQYKRNSRNCSLEYDNKLESHHITNDKSPVELEIIEENHEKPYNQFIFGDNYHALQYFKQELQGKVDLIYIDPPFGTGQEFSYHNKEVAYSDELVNHQFLEFLRKRLILLREMLSEQGSIYLHIDKKIGHYVKIIMDEIFGYQNSINDITRIKCNPKNFARNAYGNYSDMILFYAKSRGKNIWNEVRKPLSADEEKRLFPKTHPKFGRYTTHPLHAPGETNNGDTGKEWNGLQPPKGRHWRYSREELTWLDMQGLIEWSETGNPRKMVFAKDHKGKKVQDVWEFKDRGKSYVSYPTEKNHDLLRRIILNSSNKGSLVLDSFAGSGSTLFVADVLDRQWLGMDNSTKAFETIRQNFEEKDILCNYYSVKSLQ